MKEYTIDAKDMKLGRLASEVAVLLMGKNLPEYAKNKVADVKVTITNASHLDISQKKAKTKEYFRWSGYPGGQKRETLEDIVTKKGTAEAIRKAVRGMLPGNKLRPLMLKRLEITE